MSSSSHDPIASENGDDQFATTHWSLVLAAGDHESPVSQQALEELCQAYWFPVYAYVRRRTPDVHEAQDLTQAFFAQLLRKQTIANADPDRGRFRAFLLTACKRFIVNEWHKAQTKKRGGGKARLSLDFDSGESKYSVEAVDSVTPERLFEQQWAIALLARVLDRLGDEFAAKDKSQQFDQLKPFLSGSKPGEAFSEAADALGISEAAVKVAAHRLRKRYRELLRHEIAQTVATSEDVDDEIRNLFAVLGSEKT